MENTTTKRMVMRVRLSDVSDKSSAIEYVGQGTWFDGKSFVVAQYKSNPSHFYFFVYNEWSTIKPSTLTNVLNTRRPVANVLNANSHYHSLCSSVFHTKNIS